MCNCSNKIYKSYNFSDGNFLFSEKYFIDKSTIKIILCQSICSCNPEQIVNFIFGDKKIKVLNKYGKLAKIKDLKCKKLYCGLYSNEEEETILINSTN